LATFFEPGFAQGCNSRFIDIIKDRFRIGRRLSPGPDCKDGIGDELIAERPAGNSGGAAANQSPRKHNRKSDLETAQQAGCGMRAKEPP
jgi:hypothetical protein